MSAVNRAGVFLRSIILCSIAAAFMSGCAAEQKNSAPEGTKFDQVWQFPKLPPPAQYGNVIINRLTRKSTHPPVVFSHWIHRRHYTCRVCHFELGFAMKTNGTEITEERSRRGEFCGACHNDRIAFGHTEENCRICHSGNIGYSDQRFAETNGFPPAKYGDKINWVKTLRKGFIAPRQSLNDASYEPIPFDKVLRLEPEWRGIKTRAVFNHTKHTEWLDCADCHPDIFNIQKKGTKHFRMEYMLEGKFCGACHLTVAFPIQDCKRCHPDLD